MASPKASKRPKARPARASARPKARSDKAAQAFADGEAIDRANRAAKYEAEDFRTLVDKKMSGGRMKKMKAGGTCRGMGAATRGGNFYKNG